MSTAATTRRPRSVSARIGRGLRASWNTTIPLGNSQIHPSESRGYIVDSNFLIPRVRDLESEFQRELGKCLFERTVQFAEEGAAAEALPTQRDSNNNVGTPKSNRSVSVHDLSSFSSGAGANRESVRFFDSRRYLNVRPTRCTSALVQKNERFDTYFVRGTLDKYAVANAMGPVTSPHPAIGKDLHRVQIASKGNLRPFSVREAFTDKEKEEAPEEYWKQKAIEEKERKEAEEKARKEAEERARIEAIEREKREREEEKLRLIEEARARKEAEELLAFARAETEVIKAQLSEVEKARDEALTKLETLSTMSTTSKGKGKKGKSSGKGGKGKGKGKGKKGKGDTSDANSDVSSVSRKKAGKTILKSGDTDDNSSTTDSKKVTFKEKLVSTKAISPRGNRAKSPKSGGKKKNFPGSSRSKSGSAKVKGKKKKKKSPEPPPVEEAPPPPVVEEPPPVVSLEEKLPKKPKPIVLDQPPMFCLATDYKTRQQVVEEWLYLRSCSAYPTDMPLE
ncbi:uncharacterized protein [Diadema antillarum]|uniref:uncharacterized protein n=1 Tax=Diadema antillarum TaxID=105358 RepID=UPI003A89D89B